MKLLGARGTAEDVEVRLPIPRAGREHLTATGEVDAHRLYLETATQVRSVLRRLTDGPDVEDLVQEVYVVALDRREQLESATSARAWLVGVAVKVAAGYRRRYRLRRWLGLEDVPEPVSPDSPHGDAERRDAERVVQQALQALSARKREVLVLFELEGLSGQEIALAVDCPLKTVWTRLHHARRDFAEQLRRMGVAHE